MENNAFDINTSDNNITDSKNQSDKNIEDYKGYFAEGNNNHNEEDAKYYEGGAHFSYFLLYEKLKELKEKQINETSIDYYDSNNNQDNDFICKVIQSFTNNNHSLSRNVTMKKNKYTNRKNKLYDISNQSIIAIRKEQDMNNSKEINKQSHGNHSNPKGNFHQIILSNESEHNEKKQAKPIYNLKGIYYKETNCHNNPNVIQSEKYMKNINKKYEYSSKVINQQMYKNIPLKHNNNNNNEQTINNHKISTDAKGNITQRYTAKCSQINIHHHHESFKLKKKRKNIFPIKIKEFSSQAFSDEKRIKQKKRINQNPYNILSSIGFEIKNAKKNMVSHNSNHSNSNSKSKSNNHSQLHIKEKYNFLQYTINNNKASAKKHQLHKVQAKRIGRIKTLSTNNDDNNILISRNYQIDNSNYKKFKTYLDGQLNLFQKNYTKLVNEAKKGMESYGYNTSSCNIIISNQSNPISTITDSTKANSLYYHPQSKELMLHTNSNGNIITTKKTSCSNKGNKIMKRNESHIRSVYYQSPIIIEKVSQTLIHTYKSNKSILSPSNCNTKSPICPIKKAKYSHNNHNNIINQHQNYTSKYNKL